jgi:hypothetical protein
MGREEQQRNDPKIMPGKHIDIERFIMKIEDIQSVCNPRSYPVRGNYDAYAVVFGSYPLESRSLDDIRGELSDAFGNDIAISELGYLRAAVHPKFFPKHVRDDPYFEASHYRINAESNENDEYYLIQVNPFSVAYGEGIQRDNGHSLHMFSGVERILGNVHNAISELGMIDSQTYVKPCTVLGALKTESDVDAWHAIKEYCGYFGIECAKIPPDIRKYN